MGIKRVVGGAVEVGVGVRRSLNGGRGKEVCSARGAKRA